MKQRTDQEWVEQLLNEDPEATTDLWIKLREWGILSAHYLGVAEDIGEDAALNSYTKILRHLRERKDSDPLSSSFLVFCHIVVHREVLELVRREARRTSNLIALDQWETRENSGGEQDPELLQPEASIEEQVLHEEWLEIVLQGVSGLSPRERDVIQKLFLLEESPAEIAAELQISKSFIYQLKHRALTKLRQDPRIQSLLEQFGEGNRDDGTVKAGPRSLREERIRLDVATPPDAIKDEAFDVAVAVRQPDAPLLAGEDLSAVRSAEGTIYRPNDDELVRYRIVVTGVDCDVAPPQHVILLRSGKNSEPCFFQVTAHKAGQRTLFVSAYQESDTLAAQTRVRIEVQVPVEEQPIPPSATTAVINTVDIELTPAQIKQFQEALIHAFGPDDMKQVVFFGIERRWETIVASGSYDAQVHDLVMWANGNNKISSLLAAARERNSDNVKLREFEAQLSRGNPIPNDDTSCQ